MLISKTVKTNTTFHIAFMIACLLINNDMSMPFDKTLGRARDPHANGAWLSKLTERNMKCLS